MTGGRAVLVTGGASGIGAGLARGFADAGDRVLVVDVHDTEGRRVAEEIGGAYFHADVSDFAANQHAVAEAVDRFGGLDVVCLNAGVGGGSGLGARFDPDAYRRSMAVNVDGMVYGANAATTALREHGGGAIVFTTSIAALAPAVDLYYSTAKHALIGLMRSMAMLLANDHVTVNAICPGFVDTPIIAPVRDAIVQHGLALLRPAEVAALVLDVVAGGDTGQAWEIQAGRDPEQVAFRPVILSRA
ncbi:MAG TPA: SDR family NAD(P)-dependent oxidoreductase [Pseudonocardiaceae bacterium]|jgi:NAD(P)-dependent dehydrogenase (short-subunit alcohol dehydrogenase family)